MSSECVAEVLEVNNDQHEMHETGCPRTIRSII